MSLSSPHRTHQQKKAIASAGRRPIFAWSALGAVDVEIVDYH
jgi:hypothetical protein